jgi:hypothetical protein
MKFILCLSAVLFLASCSIQTQDHSSSSSVSSARTVGVSQTAAPLSVPLPAFSDLSQGAYVSGSLFYSATNTNLSQLQPGMVIRFRVDQANANGIDGQFDYYHLGYLKIDSIGTNSLIADIVVYDSNGTVLRNSTGVSLVNQVTNSLDGQTEGQILFISAPTNWRKGFDGGVFLKFLSSLSNGTRSLFMLRTSDYPGGIHPQGLVAVNIDGSAVYDLRGLLPVGGISSNGLVLSAFAAPDLRSNDRILDYDQGIVWRIGTVTYSSSGYVMLGFDPASKGGAFDFTSFKMSGSVKDLSKKFQVVRSSSSSRKKDPTTINLFSSSIGGSWTISASGSDQLTIGFNNSLDIDLIVDGGFNSGFHSAGWRVWRDYPWFNGFISGYIQMDDTFLLYATLQLNNTWDQNQLICDPTLVFDVGIPVVVSVPVTLGVQGSCSMYGAANTGVHMLGQLGGTISFDYSHWNFSISATPINNFQFNMIPLEADIAGSAKLHPYITVTPEIAACGIIGVSMPLTLYGEIDLCGNAHYHPTNKSGSLNLTLDAGFTANADFLIGIEICGIDCGFSQNLGTLVDWNDCIYSWNWPRQAGLNEPSQVTGLSASALNNGSVKLNWSPSTNASGYWVYRGTDVALVTNRCYVYDTTFIDTVSNGLIKNYYYVVSANSSQTGVKSEMVNATPLAPVIPTGLSLVTNADGTIHVNWNANGATGYYVYRIAGSNTNLYQSFGPGTYVDANVRTDTCYSYSVSALNYQGESGFTSAVSNFPAQPGLVTNIWIANFGVSGVGLAWTAVPGAQTYYVYASISPSAPLSNCRVLYTSQTAITDTVMLPYTTNYYRIIVSNRIVEGLLSTNGLSQGIPGIICGVSGNSTTVYGTNPAITGTADFAPGNPANTVWVSVNGFPFQQATITGSTPSNITWSYNSTLNFGASNRIQTYAVDNYNNKSSVYVDNVACYPNRVAKIVIAGEGCEGGGGGTNFLAWYTISAGNHVDYNMPLVGAPYTNNNFWMVSDYQPAVFTNGLPICPGTYFVLSDGSNGNNGGGGFVNHSFSFYNDYGVLLGSYSITNTLLGAVLADSSVNTNPTIFYFNGSSVNIVSQVQTSSRTISSIEIGGPSLYQTGGAEHYLGWFAINSSFQMDTQPLVGAPISNALMYINDSAPAVFSGGIPIYAGTYFVLSDGPNGSSGSCAIQPSFKFYDQYGELICTNSISAVNTAKILFDSQDTNFTLFYYDGMSVQTIQY